MSGIMSMFSNIMGGSSAPAPAAAAPTTAQQTQTTPGGIPATAPATGNANANTAPNGTVPNNPDGNPKPEATPLDQFSDLWKNDPNTANAQPASVFGQIDPKKFMEAAGKIDFTKVVTPEQLSAISQGGDGAVQAFAAALNSVAQTTYAQSAYAATKISEQATSRALENFRNELPQHMKKHAVSENLRSENPVFQNPAVQPVISALESQLTVKYPQASASEITAMAKKYVEALGTSFAPKPQAQANTPNNSGARADEDWSKFLEF